MNVSARNSAQGKRHKSVGLANVVFAHAERMRVQQVAHLTNLCSYVLVLLCSCALMQTTGCGPQEPPNVKKTRVIAAENIELKRQLDRRNKEIKMLKEQYEKETKAQKKLLQECLQEKEEWQNKSRQNIRNQVKGVLDTVLEENAKLREENKQLESQIAELQKQPQ
jgi:hypothetical protein